jgi:hypothetical protein
MTLFDHASHTELMKLRRSLIKQCDRAKYAHAKRARLERELRDATTRCLRFEISPDPKEARG